MVETSFNLFDSIVLGVVFLSTLLAFFRGFVRELLSLGSWAAAMAITLLYSPTVAKMIEQDVDKGKSASMLVASVLLFFGAKIVFSIINVILMKFLKPGKEVGLIDNFMGLFFGFARAALLLSLGYYVYSFVASEENQPKWIATSLTKPYVAQGAQMIEPYLKDFVKEVTPAVKERAEQLSPGSGEEIDKLSDTDSEELSKRLKEMNSPSQTPTPDQ